MKVAIMQPYLFPYIGYFQLINSADKFVILDDVQFINRGWINRNRIQIKDNDYLFSFSLKRDSTHKNINERFFSSRFEVEKEEFIKTLNFNYKKAPYYSQIMKLLEKIFRYKENRVSLFVSYSIKNICKYLDINTKIYISSRINNNKLKGQDKIISICKVLHANKYINAIGGQNLYSKDIFNKNNISLFFIKSSDINYEYKKEHYIPDLSIIDVLMYNSKNNIKDMLNMYILI